MKKIINNLKTKVKKLPYPSVFDADDYVLLSDVIKELELTEKSYSEGFLEQIKDKWYVRWSDLHSFGSGTHWMLTEIDLSDESVELKLIEGNKVMFEFINFGYDETSFQPNRKVRII